MGWTPGLRLLAGSRDEHAPTEGERRVVFEDATIGRFGRKRASIAATSQAYEIIDAKPDESRPPMKLDETDRVDRDTDFDLSFLRS